MSDSAYYAWLAFGALVGVCIVEAWVIWLRKKIRSSSATGRLSTYVRDLYLYNSLLIAFVVLPVVGAVSLGWLIVSISRL